MTRAIYLTLLLFTLSACSAAPRLPSVPETEIQRAQIAGFTDVRYLSDSLDDIARMQQEVIVTWQREQQWFAQQQQLTASGQLPTSHILALSGGGDKGAYGAGFLNGWTTAGTRPEFSLVTGISTGALIAPFAFLGSDYDPVLTELYTNSSSKDILKQRWPIAALNDDAMADTAPLRAQLERYITPELLAKIALEYQKGRELLISTTNIDAGRNVIWNMTKIAATDHPKAVQLFRDVMLASASIPGAFPPVLFEVELDGQVYHEMHVDGGATSQVFVYPPNLDLHDIAEHYHGQRERQLYVIMNARLDPNWAQTERRTISIAARAISSMIQTQGIGDLYRIYLTTLADDVNFNLAFIPSEFNTKPETQFDTEFMRALYQVGYQQALAGYQWQQVPPGF